jgi:hypothetical protein
MHYNPNPQLTSEFYVHPSVIITLISSGVFVHHSNGTCTRYLKNHNVRGICGILAHPAVPLLLFLMYHRSLVAYQNILRLVFLFLTSLAWRCENFFAHQSSPSHQIPLITASSLPRSLAMGMIYTKPIIYFSSLRKI